MANSNSRFPYRRIRLRKDAYYYSDQEQEAEREILSRLTRNEGPAMAKLARRCLKEKMLERGIQAIAFAVAVCPGRREWIKLLQEYLDRTGNGKTGQV